MYEDYYGFTEKPFSLTPDPKYSSRASHTRTRTSCFSTLCDGARDLSVITGDIGTAKQRCAGRSSRKRRNTFHSACAEPFLSEEDLLKLILQDFGVVSRDDPSAAASPMSANKSDRNPLRLSVELLRFAPAPS